ncbi:MAG TPA: hypothetical protein IGS53_22720 [Leptolyngbyaceae cyanobacterium M33_DOE_097]|uniref:Uncharacterized protein n=1 Tax=Oscillatoriales cyanobacterium SpSt-418 TaxID=2282169 RepID=A0A7C3PGC5_9CYAN|nr:hypothetical protein [Leptolyngbyaceae cyanobacterium M33_DOE_097]
MNKELQRIEAALRKLDKQTPAQADRQVIAAGPVSPLKSAASPIATPEVTRASALAMPNLPTLPAVTIAAQTPTKPTIPANQLPPLLEQPYPKATDETADAAQVPALPSVNKPQFTTHRNASNPALSINLLKELQRMVAGWQRELLQVSNQIQALYQEGPIVDGWLESQPLNGSAPFVRHVDANNLMEYLETAFSQTNAGPNQATPSVPGGPTTYRLCGLNEDGQLWFRECPPEQIVAVSLAIARYQKLQILTQRRQVLEERLSKLAESLIELHAQVKEV